jgi:alpha-D-xyloside xylohydrolase
MQVWPGVAYYPDWFNPATEGWWQDNVKRMYDQVPIDGLWIDMNEASNFCSGTVCVPPDPKTNNQSYYCMYLS